MNTTTNYRYWIYIFSLLVVLTGCRKDLYYDHLYQEAEVNLEIQYTLDWYIECEAYWTSQWPDEWTVDWNQIRPREPEGVRLHVFNSESHTPVFDYNLTPRGGRVKMNTGIYDLLLYNNDTEGVIIQNVEAVNRAIATTRSRSGSAYSQMYPDETIVSPPDMLFASFLPEFEIEKPDKERILTKVIDAELTPRTWTYLVRYEFTGGKEYVAEAHAYLSGMAGKVYLKDGYTPDDMIVTLMFECQRSQYGVESIIRSFGLPGYNYEKEESRQTSQNQSSQQPVATNKLVLELILLSGKTKILEFDVTNQISQQPRGGVIVVKDITVTPEEGQRPEGGSGFDGDVNDWDDNEDVEVPIT